MRLKRDFENLEKMIKDILITEPKTRNSDALLYIKVCMQLNPEARKMTFEDVILNTNELGLPTLATVGRYRRKIQQYHKELSAKAYIEACRKVKEEEFKEYSKKILNV